jgi:DNA-directed RNA polymerase specialized sigma24 family protein
VTAHTVCRLPRCTRLVGRGGLCWTHRERWRHHRDYEFNHWITADVDDVAAAAAVRRLLPGMTRRERVLLGLELTDRGLPAAEIARITHVSTRTVTRWRSARTTSGAAA